MKILKITLLISLISFLNSCGNNSNNSEAESAQEESSSALSPCELITEADITAVFSVPSDIEVKMEDKMRTFPTCSFEWDDKFTEKKVIGGNTLDIESSKEALVVLVNNATEAMYERSIVVYKDGVAVTGLGDQAIWGDKMNQLSFLSKNTLMHVHVKVAVEDAVNKAKAIEIAKLILSKIK